MSSTMDKIGRAGVFLAGGFFKIALYVCVAVLIFSVGKYSYQFGYDIFNQQAMSPGEGQEVTVVVQEGSSVYKIGKTLENKGLIRSAEVFFVQELLSDYRGQIVPGTYSLSTAYTPTRILSILAGKEVEGVENT